MSSNWKVHGDRLQMWLDVGAPTQPQSLCGTGLYLLVPDLIPRAAFSLRQV